VAAIASFQAAILVVISLALLVPLSAQRDPLPPVDQLPDHYPADLPQHLSKNFKGTSVTIALPENAPDRLWDDELLARFQDLTGIQVQVIRPGNDTTVVLSSYLKDLKSGSPQADVYAIDIVWPGILSEYAEDLRPALGRLPGMASQLVANDTVKGRLVAAPYFVELSMLYYRPDLLRKYRFSHPPSTWSELEHQARVIQTGERKSGNVDFWGYLWQGAASEALTCNAIEWRMSQGGGPLISADGTPNLKPDLTEAAWARALRWIGTISPPAVTDQLEDDSLHMWTDGNAAFMRNWPYAWRESHSDSSRVHGKIAVALLPKGEGPAGRHADTLGGFQLMLSNRSTHKQAAIELIRFLTSPEVQRFNAIHRGYLPTRPTQYGDPAVLKANPFFKSLQHALLDGAVTRPSSIAGSRYDEVSRAYFTAAHQALTGQLTAAAAVNSLDQNLRDILNQRK
jgi:trehalose/maltose transport system substrate-binding protein